MATHVVPPKQSMLLLQPWQTAEHRPERQSEALVHGVPMSKPHRPALQTAMFPAQSVFALHGEPPGSRHLFELHTPLGHSGPIWQAWQIPFLQRPLPQPKLSKHTSPFLSLQKPARQWPFAQSPSTMHAAP